MLKSEKSSLPGNACGINLRILRFWLSTDSCCSKFKVSNFLVQALEQMYEGIKDEVEAHQKALQVVSATALQQENMRVSNKQGLRPLIRDNDIFIAQPLSGKSHASYSAPVLAICLALWLQGVRAELAPWEQQMAEVQSRLDVAAAERDLLTKQQSDAKQRLQVFFQVLSST